MFSDFRREGVRDTESTDNLKQMKLGDQVLFFQMHASLSRDSGIVGVCEVIKEAYTDPTQVLGPLTLQLRSASTAYRILNYGVD